MGAIVSRVVDSAAPMAVLSELSVRVGQIVDFFARMDCLRS